MRRQKEHHEPMLSFFCYHNAVFKPLAGVSLFKSEKRALTSLQSGHVSTLKERLGH